VYVNIEDNNMTFKQAIANAVEKFAGRVLTTEQVVALTALALPEVPEAKIRANVSPAYYCHGSQFGAELFAKTGQRGLYRVLSASERTIKQGRSKADRKPLAETASELLATLEQEQEQEQAE
jgi:hypothetical protein